MYFARMPKTTSGTSTSAPAQQVMYREELTMINPPPPEVDTMADPNVLNGSVTNVDSNVIDGNPDVINVNPDEVIVDPDPPPAQRTV